MSDQLGYPKKLRIKLDQKSYHELRKAVWNRALRHCEVCGRYVKWEEMTYHHIKSRGAGGDDTLENGMCCHKLCHPP